MTFINISDINPLKKYSSIELFAGSGGLALGLELAGFESKALLEIDNICCNTLKYNRPQWNVINEDICKYNIHNLNQYIDKYELDLLSGGYPCQSFSYAGKRRGLNDARGTLFYYYANILKYLQPKIFLAENVKGLLNHDDGNTLATMISIFENCGYVVHYHTLNAWNYGVAQKRERIFIIGVRKDIQILHKYPEPFKYRPTLKDVLQNVPKSKGTKYSKYKSQILDMIPQGGYWKDLPVDVQKEYLGNSYYLSGGKTGIARRLSWDEPSLTLTCSPAQKQTERCHPEETRPLTIREYARIQSFPDDWIFTGSICNQYKQIGNAVPVNLGKAIGLSIIEVLNKIN